MAHAAYRLLVALSLTAGVALAYEATPDRRAIEEAIVVGQSRVEATRIRFHEPYRIRVAMPPVDYLEVVTPFRRVVLAAEARARSGGGLFGQREALEALDAFGNTLELIAELTFHPLNTYVGVPEYQITLRGPGAGPPLEPREIDRLARFGPRLDGSAVSLPYPGPGLPDGSQPLLGSAVIARFDGRLLNPRGVYEIAIEEMGKPLARARVDLGGLR
jgi:hypothetical protein